MESHRRLFYVQENWRCNYEYAAHPIISDRCVESMKYRFTFHLVRIAIYSFGSRSIDLMLMSLYSFVDELSTIVINRPLRWHDELENKVWLFNGQNHSIHHYLKDGVVLFYVLQSMRGILAWFLNHPFFFRLSEILL